MSKTVPAGSKAWNDQSCVKRDYQRVSYSDPAGGNTSDFEWVSSLKCHLTNINPKRDYCTTCNTYLQYP